MNEDADMILDMIRAEGKLNFTDKADPELIKEKTGLSKAAFKRAVGRLLKRRKIIIKGEEIYEAVLNDTGVITEKTGKI